MQPTIILDAGHGGFDNGATYQGRREKDDNLRLTLLVGDALEKMGFPVLFTRTTDIYQRPIEKAQLANSSSGEYFVSIHRNSSPEANQYNGVETLVYRDEGIPAEMARTVNDRLEQVGFKKLKVSVRPELVVLRRTKMPAILIEAGFLNSDQDNRLFDERINEIAQAIADGIADVVGEQKESYDNVDYNGEIQIGETSKKHFAVQVGLFRRYENAMYLRNELEERGYQAEILQWKEYFSVIVGNENNLERAREIEKELQKKGYDTLLVNRW